VRPPFAFPPFNPIQPLAPKQPDPLPPREEPPAAKEPADDIHKIGNKISDAAEAVAGKVEAFRELIEDRQDDINEAVETFREIGRALESTGRQTDEKVGANPMEAPTSLHSLHSQQPWPSSIRGEIDDAVRGAISRLELKTAGRKTREATEEVVDKEVADHVEAFRETSKESRKEYLWWLGWVAAAAAAAWGVTRKPK